MSETTCAIRGIDTLLFRDGRPFSGEAGERADTLALPMPSTVAGLLRTKYGRARYGEQCDWSAVSNALRLRGPLLIRNGQVLLPAPADALPFYADGNAAASRSSVLPLANATAPASHSERAQLSIAALRPWSAKDLNESGAGTDLPGGMRPLRIAVDKKPARGFELWTWDSLESWLLEAPCVPGDFKPALPPSIDQRVHIERDAKTGGSREGRLFSTSMVAFERYAWTDFEPEDEGQFGLLCRVSGVDEDCLFGPGALGGENRCTVVQPADPELWPVCPDALKAGLAGARRVRMILATPAIFECGWIPRWLDKTTKTGSPPGLADRIVLKLVAAAVPRRQAVSGWEYSDKPGPRQKPVRWCAPAGSVYFFEIVSGDASLLATESWLESVSDDEQTRTGDRLLDKNRSDGFGLALWGLWNEQENA